MQFTVQIIELREHDVSLILPLLVRNQFLFLTIRTLHILNSAIEVIIHDSQLVFSLGQQLSKSMQLRYQVPTQPVFPQHINQQHLKYQQFQRQVLVTLLSQTGMTHISTCTGMLYPKSNWILLTKTSVIRQSEKTGNVAFSSRLDKPL